MSPHWLCVWCVSEWRGWLSGSGWSLVSPCWLCEWCFRGRVGGGVWFPHGNSVCAVCVCEWCRLRIELGVEIGCSVAGALVVSV